MVVLGLLTTISVAGFTAALRLLVARARRRPLPSRDARLAKVLVGVLALELAGLAYAFWLEPHWVEVSFNVVPTGRLGSGQRVRIVHLSDTHVTGPDAVFASLPERVAALDPDLVIFTGDAATSGPDLTAFRETLARVPARLGRFAVRGNHETAYWPDTDVFAGAAQELVGAPVQIPGTPIVLCGASYHAGEAVLRCLAAHRDDLTVAVYHTPDLVEEAAPLKPALYLAGHTHGGQVRIPFYGALITLSEFDKKYEAGAYHVGETLLYVSRGLGFEPGAAPRVRFNCRPEIAVLDLVGAAN
jgi:uncharacterized protein